MKRVEFLLVAAWTVQLLAWCFPVMDGGGGWGPHQVWGWSAWYWTTGIGFGGLIQLPLDPAAWHDGWKVFPYAFVYAVSSFSGIWFIVGSSAVVGRSSRKKKHVVAWVTLACWVVNCHYLFEYPVAEFRAGYYLWWSSFLLLSGAFFAYAADLPPAEAVRSPSPETAA